MCCVTVLIRILPAFVSERRRRGGGEATLCAPREAGVFPLGHERQRLLPAARVLQREHDAHHLVQGQVLGSTLPVQMLVQRQARGGQAQAFGAGQRDAGVNGAVHHRPDDVHLTVIEHLQVITTSNYETHFITVTNAGRFSRTLR